MRKKFYFLINSLEGGGAERTIVTMATRLSLQHDVTIITLKDVIFYELPANIQYRPLSLIKSNMLMLLFFPYYIFSFRRILKRESFDGGMSSLEIANFVNILSQRNAHIAFETSMGFFKGIIGFFYKILIRLLYPLAGKIKVNSEENQFALAKNLNIPKEKISIIYNPLDISAINTKKEESISSELSQIILGKKVFITVARLIESKYHSKIIESFSRVDREIDQNWIYLIVGDGIQKGSLQKQVEDYGLGDHIIFLGAQQNVFKYLACADYFVYASQVEGFPNVLGEAMACDLPIITSDFKTGAQECIIGEFNPNNGVSLVYPYYGPNGVLLNLDNYQDEFLKVYIKLDMISQKKIGFEKFSLAQVEKDILFFLSSL